MTYELEPLLKFLISGLLVFFIYFGIIFLLTKHFDAGYRVAVSVALFVSVIAHFFINRSFSFKKTGKTDTREILRYLGLILLNYLVTLMIVSGCVEVFGLNQYGGALVALTITTPLGFFGLRFFVFRVRVK